jgi:RsiW-degrading membrane proteinase PrsW (M82 family)
LRQVERECRGVVNSPSQLDARSAAGPTPPTTDSGVAYEARLVTEGLPGNDASLTQGERLLRNAIVQVPPRMWLWLSLFAASHFLGFPVALAFIAAIFAALFFVSIVWQVDVYEEEPWRLIERTFFWGAVPAVMLAMIGELVLDGSARFLVGSTQTKWIEAGLVAPVVEELCKGVVLVNLLRRHSEEFDGMLDGLLYGALVGLGFSMTENITYYLAAEPGHLNALITVRGVLFGMNHACFSACFGFGLGLAADATTPGLRRWAPIAGLVAGVGLHMANNFIAMTQGAPPQLAALGLGGGALFIWFRLVGFARAREAQWIKKELTDEVRRGVMTAEEAAAISDVQMRKATRAAAFQENTYGPANARLRLYALATALAFAKHKAKVDRSHAYGGRIIALRRGITWVRAERWAAGWMTGGYETFHYVEPGVSDPPPSHPAVRSHVGEPSQEPSSLTVIKGN